MSATPTHVWLRSVIEEVRHLTVQLTTCLHFPSPARTALAIDELIDAARAQLHHLAEARIPRDLQLVRTSLMQCAEALEQAGAWHLDGSTEHARMALAHAHTNLAAAIEEARRRRIL